MRYITSIERLGREEGREEKSLEVARRMLARGSDRAFILEVTDLSEKDLAGLEKEIEAKKGDCPLLRTPENS